MTLAHNLLAAIQSLPDQATISFPVGWLRAELEEEARAPVEPAKDLTVEELAGQLGRAPSTVRGWLIGGEIPEAYKLHKKEWRIPRAAIARYLDRQASGEAPGPALGSARAVNLGEYRKHLQRTNDGTV